MKNSIDHQHLRMLHSPSERQFIACSRGLLYGVFSKPQKLAILGFSYWLRLRINEKESSVTSFLIQTYCWQILIYICLTGKCLQITYIRSFTDMAIMGVSKTQITPETNRTTHVVNKNGLFIVRLNEWDCSVLFIRGKYFSNLVVQ